MKKLDSLTARANNRIDTGGILIHETSVFKLIK